MYFILIMLGFFLSLELNDPDTRIKCIRHRVYIVQQAYFTLVRFGAVRYSTVQYSKVRYKTIVIHKSNHKDEINNNLSMTASLE